MKIRIKIILLAVLSISLFSCTEVIKLDLNSSDPQIVVEGSVPNNDFAKIRITKSINFDAANEFPYVENAMVKITDNTGNSEVLTETSPGIYQSKTLKGEVARTYNLTIETNGKTLSSTSIIPNLVPFDSLILKKETGGMGGPGGPGGPGNSGTNYQIAIKFNDPVGEKNYYRFVEYVNGVPSGDNFILDDRIFNGTTIINPLRRSSIKLKSGDILVVKMQCIDKFVYEYFNSFGNLMGGPQSSSTPANPYTNIIGSKLGFFSAQTSESKQVVIP